MKLIHSVRFRSPQTEASDYILFYKRHFCSSAGGTSFFMTFLNDSGCHLDLGINLEWPQGLTSIHYQSPISYIN